MIDVDLLTAQLARNPAASTEKIREFATRSKASLPEGYIEFMQRFDGAEGPIGRKGRYIVLWPVASIIHLNEQYHFDEFAPHLLAFGSDGGGEAFAFDRRTEPATIVRVPFIGMDEEVHYGTRFDEFLSRLSEE